MREAELAATDGSRLVPLLLALGGQEPVQLAVAVRLQACVAAQSHMRWMELYISWRAKMLLGPASMLS